MKQADLVIKNAKIYTNGTFFQGAVAVRDGMIASVCTDSEIPEAEKVIDAEGKYLLPGMIESHMHVREPGRPDRGTFFTETKAAAAGGVTTILEHPIAKPPQYSKEILERRIAKTTKVARNDKAAAKELALLEKIKAHLEDGRLAKTFDAVEDEEEEEWLKSYNLLTYKPVIYAANVSEDDLADDGASNAGVQAVREYAAKEESEVFVVCAEIEAEISELDDDEKKMFLEDLGLTESGLEKLIKASYKLLGLISYLTAGEPEVRAWTITEGTKAPQAAGKIHSDFERGFIRAEVVSYDDLIACGIHAAAKEKGLIRLEGKEYVVKDGDIMLFRFNV